MTLFPPLPDVRYVDVESLGGDTTPRTALAIGNFDGVHRGHAAVLSQLTALAATRGLQPAVLTFDPHPAVVLGKTAPARLTTMERRIELFGRHGVRIVFVANFTRALAETSAQTFAEGVFFGALGAEVVVVGSDFRFGKGRAGHFSMLRSFAESAPEHREAFAAVIEADADGPISSTRVRAALAEGNVHHASELLGRPHAFSGEVVLGAQKGRTIGFPTANLDGIEEACPANGVYAVSVDLLSRAGEHDKTAPSAPTAPTAPTAIGHGVMNVGTRPTVSGGETRRHVEVFLFGFEGDLYGRRLRVHVHERVRDERKFPSFDALKTQIAADAARARELTSSMPVPVDAPFG